MSRLLYGHTPVRSPSRFQSLLWKYVGHPADFPAFGGGVGQRMPDDDFDRIVERTRALAPESDD